MEFEDICFQYLRVFTFKLFQWSTKNGKKMDFIVNRVFIVIHSIATQNCQELIIQFWNSESVMCRIFKCNKAMRIVAWKNSHISITLMSVRLKGFYFSFIIRLFSVTVWLYIRLSVDIGILAIKNWRWIKFRREGKWQIQSKIYVFAQCTMFIVKESEKSISKEFERKSLQYINMTQTTLYG